MSASIERPPGASVDTLSCALPGGLSVSEFVEVETTLAALPVGARLILRCRKDWRDAVVASVSVEVVTLSVGTPKGRTYRVRRPASTPILQDGPIPVLGKGSWRAGLVRYDARW